MSGRVARRVVAAVGVLLAAATVTFLLEQLMPGDPGVAVLGGAGAHPTDAQIAAIDHQYGFDRPVLAQYLTFMGHLLQGDLGQSYSLKQDVTTVISQQVGPTLALTLVALALAWVVAVAGTLLTAGRGRLRSSLGSGAEAVLAGLPQYWLGIVLLVVFSFNLHWAPVAGGTSLEGLVLPALTLALPLAGFLGQVTRDEFSGALEQPFAVSARARGMGEGAVRRRHVLRHAVLPGITLSGWALGALLSGSVIVEVVFARPGLGQLLVNAVNGQDLPVVVGITLLVALVYVVANLLVDLLYAIVDPRLRTPARG
ncbi:MAG TPA: ABC transporter permease [Baekduia sp.]|uniref:ABC transporter permease n=1 Tax=Baekduia sp. TaxID=2600305 RepID=UPI002B8C713C|nr:ABC transporter permease [Baekduia sp.]HMJ34451.1 ABC transporter permease [Baekduia sp.]